jgi:hypothetical protein
MLIVPITVNCSCGKIFKVRDEFVGKEVMCQVCGQKVMAQDAAMLRPALNFTTPKNSETVPATNADSINCPACAESIPVQSAFCPLCGEVTGTMLAADDQAAMLQERIKLLDAHIASPTAKEADIKIKGGFFATKTIVVGLFAGLGLFLIVSGSMMAARDGGGVIAVGIVLGLIFGICLIVSLVNDNKSNHIQDVDKPEEAFRRFYKAIQTNRANKAFISLIPSARKTGPVKTIKFKNASIPPCTGSYRINDLTSFKEYWKSVLRGPSMQTRQAQLKTVTLTRWIGDDMAVVEAEVKFTNYPSLILLTVFLHLLICLIVILVVQKTETQKIRKLLIKRNGLWYVVEGEFQGRLDNVTL